MELGGLSARAWAGGHTNTHRQDENVRAAAHRDTTQRHIHTLTHLRAGTCPGRRPRSYQAFARHTCSTRMRQSCGEGNGDTKEMTQMLIDD